MSSSTPKSALYIPHSGPSLLETPLLNKGSAFTAQERVAFNLTGLIPPRYESIEEQVERAYMQYSSFNEPINKHIYLRAIQDNNETLYYRLWVMHVSNFPIFIAALGACLFPTLSVIKWMTSYVTPLSVK